MFVHLSYNSSSCHRVVEGKHLPDLVLVVVKASKQIVVSFHFIC